MCLGYTRARWPCFLFFEFNTELNGDIYNMF